VGRQGFQPLPISLDHAARAASLAHAHRDPWDRVIAALGARVVW
jgi:PIN domain nuclease of toxin-antitoxin system